MNSKLNKNLTSFEIFQMRRYGNILSKGKGITSEELENGSRDAEIAAEKVNNHFELELLKD